MKQQQTGRKYWDQVTGRGMGLGHRQGLFMVIPGETSDFASQGVEGPRLAALRGRELAGLGRRSMARPQRPSRRGIGRRRKGVSLWLGLLALLLLLLLLAGGPWPAGGQEQQAGSSWRLVTVHQGDTLWDLAEEVAAPGADIGRIVYHIQLANDLDGGLIYPGQVLRLPLKAQRR